MELSNFKSYLDDAQAFLLDSLKDAGEDVVEEGKQAAQHLAMLTLDVTKGNVTGTEFKTALVTIRQTMWSLLARIAIEKRRKALDAAYGILEALTKIAATFASA